MRTLVGLDIESFKNLVDIYTVAIDSLYEYAYNKMELNDMHAVADASVDIRELNAKIEVYNHVIGQLEESLRVAETERLSPPGKHNRPTGVFADPQGERNSPIKRVGSDKGQKGNSGTGNKGSGQGGGNLQ